ncbi:hypothetical protein PRZ48_013172 [Zasmidium cellare]|uniref:Uncharacterized protein n=1 Tax=Zasmidium cellare TaxID=395010 RepID=A0ABR0E3A3_ZASCE|nr:hypothetical protein PRZ48_013172 [Zasmidium cellare]
MANSMPFIISSVGEYGDDAKNRQLVRRHVMLGKNKGKKRPKRGCRFQPDHEPDADHPHLDKVPPKLGTDLSFIDFADTVELSLIGDILKFSRIAKQTFFPLEPCIAFDKKLKFQQSFVPLTHDALYLNAMVFSTQSWFCKGTGREIDKRVSYHLVKSISLLRDRLMDGGQATTSNTTINAVVMLAGQALLMGEAKTAREHVFGLRRLVEMRGGFGRLKGNVKLVMEVVRMDLSLAMFTGTGPVLRETASTGIKLPEVKAEELLQLWLTMHNFTNLINNATSTCHKLPEELMLGTMTSVMYRLLTLKFEELSLNEAMRLGLLAFCSQAFLPWTSVKLPFDVFPDAYSAFLEAVTDARSIPSGMIMWLLTIGVIALYPPAGCRSERMLSLLRNIIVDSGVTSWGDMRKTLKEYLWLDLIFDDAAEDLWKRVIQVHE